MKGLRGVELWLCRNRLKMNAKKRKCMIIKESKPEVISFIYRVGMVRKLRGLKE